MALLSENDRKYRFNFLGLGEYNKQNLLKFQKMAFKDKSQHDAVYGKNTDNALRTFYNVRKVAPNFEPQEFRCTCGHCCGYPTFMRTVELRHIQAIRNHYKKPMKITSALRCAYENRQVGGVQNSGHMRGYAVDFYMPGVTDTVNNRYDSMAWIVKQPNHEFTYGAHMRDSNGLYRTASGMGNAMHTETHKPAKQVSKYYASSTILGQAACNEKGTLKGGKAGDQKKEVAITGWYNGGWKYVFRAKDASKRLLIAQAMIDSCLNDNIGYDTKEPDRFTAWDAAEKNGHDIAGIKIKCETTCSQDVSMCLRAAGYSKKIAPRQADVVSLTNALNKNGLDDFYRFTDRGHTRSPKKLRAGDVCISGTHAVIIVKTPRE